MLVPPLVQTPILILAVLIIRDACQRSIDSLSLTVSSSPSSELALSHLHDLATTSFLWTPSLALPDPQLILPLLTGVVFLANVELGAKTRAAVMQSVRAGEADRATDTQVRERFLEKESIEKRSRDAIQEWKLKRKGPLRTFSTTPERARSEQASIRVSGNERSSEDASEAERPEDKDRTNRIITNALRVASVALIPIFAAAPAVSPRTAYAPLPQMKLTEILLT